MSRLPARYQEVDPQQQPAIQRQGSGSARALMPLATPPHRSSSRAMDTNPMYAQPAPRYLQPSPQPLSSRSAPSPSSAVSGISLQMPEEDPFDEKIDYSHRRNRDSMDSTESSDKLLDYTFPRSTQEEKFYTSADPTGFYDSVYQSGATGGPGDFREDDDHLHNPSARDLESGHTGTIFTRRGIANVGFLVVLMLGIILLFAGYPIISHFARVAPKTLGAFNLGGINATGQVPQLTGFPSMIDKDTPSSAYHHTSLEDGSRWDLVFSDEFERPNRTFYPGDDPYFEAVDFHYHATNDLEWYDPRAVTTEDGSLKLTLDKIRNHDLDYRGGMLQSWNKMCFTGGYIEVSVSLPGLSSISGLWPAVWTMGNLGRAGYGSTTDGTWPYSYDACDVGTLHNQTLNNEPAAALSGGDPANGGALSFLPGQRLSACTCPGELHPGPVKPDGTYTGRSAPEIDVIEAIVNNGVGQASQSLQVAPFDDGYNWANSSAEARVFDTTGGGFNSYRGGIFQQSVSGIFDTDQTAYAGFATNGQRRKYATYGFEYTPGLDGYVTWVQNGKPSWSARAGTTGANPRVNISARPIPQEPMYLIMNLGISPSFGFQDPALQFPAIMYIDYVRVYQDPSKKNVGCSPPDFPTEDYINTLSESYNNPNMTTFAEAGQTFPKNRLIDTCS